MADWLLELPGDRLVLHPVTHRWLSFDAAHDGWLSTGIVPGEAILVSLGMVLGAKRALREDETRLPLDERIERIAARVVVAVDGELAGPMELEAAQALKGERPACHPPCLEYPATAMAGAPRHRPLGPRAEMPGRPLHWQKVQSRHRIPHQHARSFSWG